MAASTQTKCCSVGTCARAAGPSPRAAGKRAAATPVTTNVACAPAKAAAERLGRVVDGSGDDLDAVGCEGRG